MWLAYTFTCSWFFPLAPTFSYHSGSIQHCSIWIFCSAFHISLLKLYLSTSFLLPFLVHFLFFLLSQSILLSLFIYLFAFSIKEHFLSNFGWTSADMLCWTSWLANISLSNSNKLRWLSWQTMNYCIGLWILYSLLINFSFRI